MKGMKGLKGLKGLKVEKSIISHHSSIFNIQHSIFNIQHSIFNIQFSIFNIQHSIFNIQLSIFNIQHSISSIFLSILFVTTMLLSCSSEGYDTGDGELSYLKADFVEARTASAKMFVSATTDDGVDLLLSPALECEWATTVDSIYRALLYYKIGEGNAVEPVTVSRVMVLEPHAMADGDEDRKSVV